MNIVIEKKLPASSRIMTRSARDVFVVTDEDGNESWECQTRIAAEMFCACMNEDGTGPRDKEFALQDFLREDCDA